MKGHKRKVWLRRFGKREILCEIFPFQNAENSGRPKKLYLQAGCSNLDPQFAIYILERCFSQSVAYRSAPVHTLFAPICGKIRSQRWTLLSSAGIFSRGRLFLIEDTDHWFTSWHKPWPHCGWNLGEHSSREHSFRDPSHGTASWELRTSTLALEAQYSMKDGEGKGGEHSSRIQKVARRRPCSRSTGV